jgi:hypothetical protein
MDLVAAAILTWTCAMSFDYSLAWEFHKLSCTILKRLGMHRLDAAPTDNRPTDPLILQKRSSFWQVVLIDIFFRLCYDKASEVSGEASTQLVNLPDIINPVSEQPQAVKTVHDIIWYRVIFLARLFLERLDQARIRADGIADPDFQRMADETCDHIEKLTIDWQLVIFHWVHVDLADRRAGCLDGGPGE